MSANYPFCTIEPNEAAVGVPDPRVDGLAKMFSPKKITYASVSFADIAGLVRGASKGEGLGNKFLSHIREADALVHVVRCFEDSNIQHVSGRVDPIDDVQTINLELILADLETVAKREEKARKQLKVGDKKLQLEVDTAAKVRAHLEREKPARTCDLSDMEKEVVRGWFMLTDKPVMYAANIAEDDISADEDAIPNVLALKRLAADEGAELLVISAQIEAELAGMDAEDRAVFMEELGIAEAGLDRFARTAYRLLGLISFLTAGADECRAWTINRGDKAPQAAGKIHSDFERGFIRAEVVPYDTLIREGSMSVCKEKGLVRSEGKEYVMRDGDVTLFRFNV
jgi:GTP-binding protein YchF